VTLTITPSAVKYQTTSTTMVTNSTSTVMADFYFDVPIVMLQTYLVNAMSDPLYPTICVVTASFNLYQITTGTISTEN
jgi:hypothetical protein